MTILPAEPQNRLGGRGFQKLHFRFIVTGGHGDGAGISGEVSPSGFCLPHSGSRMEFFAEFLHVPSRLFLGVSCVCGSCKRHLCSVSSSVTRVSRSCRLRIACLELAVSPLTVPDGSLVALRRRTLLSSARPTPAPSFPVFVPRRGLRLAGTARSLGLLVFMFLMHVSSFSIHPVLHVGLSCVWTCPFFSCVKELAIYFYFPKCFY